MLWTFILFCLVGYLDSVSLWAMLATDFSLYGPGVAWTVLSVLLTWTLYQLAWRIYDDLSAKLEMVADYRGPCSKMAYAVKLFFLV